MDNKRIVCRVVNGEMVPVSDDPIQIIEDVCIRRTGELKFTSAKEMSAYDEIIEKSAHAEKFKLRLLRESAGLSYDAISTLLGISKDGYFKIESGRTYPKLQLALKIAKLFGTTVEDLFVVE